MSNLPTIDWNVSPIFFQIPRPVVLGITALIAGYSLFQDLRKNRSSAPWTLLLFGGLTALAWKFAEAKLGYGYFFLLVGALILEGMRRKASDHYVTAALFAALGFVAWRFLPESLDLRYYSLLFVGVFLGGYSFLKWQIVRGGGPAEDAGDFIVYGVLGVLVGARLGHVLFYDLDKALADPAWIVMIWTGGLASHGAVIGLIVAMWLFTKSRGVAFLEGADRFAWSAALGATLVRFGNLMNSEIVGRRTANQDWGFRFPRFDHGDKIPLRYPTQIGEVLLGLLVLAMLYAVDKRFGKEKRPRGLMISTFFVVYFIGRFVIEFWKEYEPPLPEGVPYPTSLTTGQLLSLPGIALGIYGFYWAFKHHVPAGWPNARLAGGHGERRGSKQHEDEDEDAEDEDAEDEAPRRAKGRKAGKKRGKAAAPVEKPVDKPAAGEDDEDDDLDEDESDKRGTDRDDDLDEDEDDKRGTDRDDTDDDLDEDEDEDEDEAHAKPRDADIDDEFDDKGALKKRRGPPEG